MAGLPFELLVARGHESLFSFMDGYGNFELSRGGVQGGARSIECIFRLRVDGELLWEGYREELISFSSEGVDCCGYRLEGGRFGFEYSIQKGGVGGYRLITSGDYSIAYCSIGSCSKEGAMVLNNMIMMLFAFCSSRFSALMLHASVVVNGGRGFLFTGRSGTGKSTHSGLWLRYVDGSELLNDDNPILRVETGSDGDERVVVWGSPWSGKTPCYLNRCAPVGAVVRLYQAKDSQNSSAQNLIKRDENPIRAFASLLPSCSTAPWDISVENNIYNTVERVVSLIPTYTLHCLPNAHAARYCYAAVGGAVGGAVGAVGAVGGVRCLSADVVFDEVRHFIAQGRSVTLKATGNSMRPTICNLDVVVVWPVDAGAIRRFDIVLAQLADGRYVIHRVVKVLRAGRGLRAGGELLGFVLMGDANLVGSEVCMAGEIIGRVTCRGVGRWMALFGIFWTLLRPLRLAVVRTLQYKLKFLKS